MRRALKLTIKIVQITILLFTLGLGITAIHAAYLHFECQSELRKAAANLPASLGGTNNNIDVAFKAPSCLKMTSFAKIVQNIFE